MLKQALTPGEEAYIKGIPMPPGLGQKLWSGAKAVASAPLKLLTMATPKWMYPLAAAATLSPVVAYEINRRLGKRKPAPAALEPAVKEAMSRIREYYRNPSAIVPPRSREEAGMRAFHGPQIRRMLEEKGYVPAGYGEAVRQHGRALSLKEKLRAIRSAQGRELAIWDPGATAHTMRSADEIEAAMKKIDPKFRVGRLLGEGAEGIAMTIPGRGEVPERVFKTYKPLPGLLPAQRIREHIQNITGGQVETPGGKYQFAVQPKADPVSKGQAKALIKKLERQGYTLQDVDIPAWIARQIGAEPGVRAAQFGRVGGKPVILDEGVVVNFPKAIGHVRNLFRGQLPPGITPKHLAIGGGVGAGLIGAGALGYHMLKHRNAPSEEPIAKAAAASADPREIAAAWHAGTFNIDAAKKKGPFQARVIHATVGNDMVPVVQLYHTDDPSVEVKAWYPFLQNKKWMLQPISKVTEPHVQKAAAAIDAAIRQQAARDDANRPDPEAAASGIENFKKMMQGAKLRARQRANPEIVTSRGFKPHGPHPGGLQHSTELQQYSSR